MRAEYVIRSLGTARRDTRSFGDPFLVLRLLEMCSEASAQTHTRTHAREVNCATRAHFV